MRIQTQLDDLKQILARATDIIWNSCIVANALKITMADVEFVVEAKLVKCKELEEDLKELSYDLAIVAFD